MYNLICVNVSVNELSTIPEPLYNYVCHLAIILGWFFFKAHNNKYTPTSWKNDLTRPVTFFNEWRTCVHEFMASQVMAAAEAQLTNNTPVRPFTCVDSHMTPQVLETQIGKYSNLSRGQQL